MEMLSVLLDKFCSQRGEISNGKGKTCPINPIQVMQETGIFYVV
jgi:hypothetical protein